MNSVIPCLSINADPSDAPTYAGRFATGIRKEAGRRCHGANGLPVIGFGAMNHAIRGGSPAPPSMDAGATQGGSGAEIGPGALRKAALYARAWCPLHCGLELAPFGLGTRRMNFPPGMGAAWYAQEGTALSVTGLLPSLQAARRGGRPSSVSGAGLNLGQATLLAGGRMLAS